MKAARDLGIPTKVFDGTWTPTRTTTYEYDDGGRLVRATTVEDSPWDADEQELMLALARCDANTCSGCGGWLPETMSREADVRGYEAEIAGRCHACTALSERQEIHAKNSRHVHATRWSAHLKPKG